jgi:hypothetical protein
MNKRIIINQIIIFCFLFKMNFTEAMVSQKIPSVRDLPSYGKKQPGQIKQPAIQPQPGKAVTPTQPQLGPKESQIYVVPRVPQASILDVPSVKDLPVYGRKQPGVQPQSQPQIKQPQSQQPPVYYRPGEQPPVQIVTPTKPSQVIPVPAAAAVITPRAPGWWARSLLPTGVEKGLDIMAQRGAEVAADIGEKIGLVQMVESMLNDLVIKETIYSFTKPEDPNKDIKVRQILIAIIVSQYNMFKFSTTPAGALNQAFNSTFFQLRAAAKLGKGVLWIITHMMKIFTATQMSGGDIVAGITNYATNMILGKVLGGAVGLVGRGYSRLFGSTQKPAFIGPSPSKMSLIPTIQPGIQLRKLNPGAVPSSTARTVTLRKLSPGQTTANPTIRLKRTTNPTPSVR